MRRSAFGWSVLFCVAAGCMPPQLPAEKLSDTAHEVVMAARFGRMDIVFDSVDGPHREAFIEAHAEWGGKIRILDIEYGGARLVTSDRAVVLMSVAWQRVDESMLRNTSLKQTWRLGEKRWTIMKEEIAGGDQGLIREAVPEIEAKPKKVAAATEGAAATAD